MKSSFKSVNLRGLLKPAAGTLAVALAFLTFSKPASAYLIIDSMVDPRGNGLPLPQTSDGLAIDMDICFLLLPLCVLDEKAGGHGSASRTELAANGYSPEEIDQIMKDQYSLTARLEARRVALKITENDTKQSVDEAVRSIDPEASNAYVDYLTESLGVK